jgi:hypothetical protein
MDIALLKRVTVEIGNDATIETFELIDNMKVNETAMLKARTLVAYLSSIDKLRLIEVEDWIVGYPESGMKNISMKLDMPDFPGASAMIPVKFREKSWNQPGIIAVRNTVEDRKILFDSFLKSSLKWLDGKPQEKRMLDNIWGVHT